MGVRGVHGHGACVGGHTKRELVQMLAFDEPLAAIGLGQQMRRRRLDDTRAAMRLNKCRLPLLFNNLRDDALLSLERRVRLVEQGAAARHPRVGKVGADTAEEILQLDVRWRSGGLDQSEGDDLPPHRQLALNGHLHQPTARLRSLRPQVRLERLLQLRRGERELALERRALLLGRCVHLHGVGAVLAERPQRAPKRLAR